MKKTLKYIKKKSNLIFTDENRVGIITNECPVNIYSDIVIYLKDTHPITGEKLDAE